MNDLAVTLEHIRKAAEWAQACLDLDEDEEAEEGGARNDPHPIDGHVRAYDQSTWDCGTACCIWGAAHLLATGQSSNNGPSIGWAKQSELHDAVWRKLIRSETQPADVLELLK